MPAETWSAETEIKQVCNFFLNFLNFLKMYFFIFDCYANRCRKLLMIQHRAIITRHYRRKILFNLLFFMLFFKKKNIRKVVRWYQPRTKAMVHCLQRHVAANVVQSIRQWYQKKIFFCFAFDSLFYCVEIVATLAKPRQTPSWLYHHFTRRTSSIHCQSHHTNQKSKNS